ncbi:hypothetical protein M413DRAFT_446149 [Hebeloma cylindrosporum]|uniref:Uncharacterized protein n=1 Tax=Hebeloma cylindrosporum TaxID=76867 RepID=A0A0C3CAZ5_HEBCY|nr:hypothetical protein M413DRAFT_446149 [Hebeloma cylindrosporum h7]
MDLKKPPQIWHPRITPYRLLVLVVTVSFGMTKAVLTYKDETIIPITLEWIAGVVVSLFLFFLGIYESGNAVPRYLSWMFEPDCMDVVWRILRIISIPRPYYTSEELDVVRVPHDNYPPVSGYRILVSMLVITFGIGKAACAYFGLPTAANSVDWTFGVVATSILYVLGLYENNTVDFWPAFFATDYTDTLLNGSYQGYVFSLHTLGLFACGAWSYFWLRTLINYVYTPLILDRKIRSDFDEIHNLSIKTMMSFIFLILVALGIIPIFTQLWAIGRAVSPLRTFTRAIRRLFVSNVATRISPLYSQARTESTYLNQAITFLSRARATFLYILSHLLGAVACITLGAVFLGFFIQIWAVWKVQDEGFIESSALLMTLTVIGGMVALGVFVLFVLFRSLLQVKF